MMLNRSNDVEIDFEFNKVNEKNKDNHIFYVQYAYARINSLFRTINFNLYKNIILKENDFNPNSYEVKLLRKVIEWPKIIETASAKLEPHRITFYLYELSTIFHSYWSEGNRHDDYKFIINGKINNIHSFKIFQLISIILKMGCLLLVFHYLKKCNVKKYYSINLHRYNNYFFNFCFFNLFLKINKINTYNKIYGKYNLDTVDVNKLPFIENDTDDVIIFNHDNNIDTKFKKEKFGTY